MWAVPPRALIDSEEACPLLVDQRCPEIAPASRPLHRVSTSMEPAGRLWRASQVLAQMSA